MKINVIDEKYRPIYSTSCAAGADVRARVDGDAIALLPNSKVVIPLGFSLEEMDRHEANYYRLGLDYVLEAHIRGRSGLWFKHDITVGQMGTIDADYPNEVCIKLFNHGDKTFYINDGDRVGQIVFARAYRPISGDDGCILSDFLRSDGFGSTGVK